MAGAYLCRPAEGGGRRYDASRTQKKLDSLTPNTGALADGMQAVLLGGLLGKGEAVGAANPYGCNGEQHQPGCPRGMDGEASSVRKEKGNEDSEQSKKRDKFVERLPKKVRAARELAKETANRLKEKVLTHSKSGHQVEISAKFIDEADTWMSSTFKNLHNDCCIGYNEAKRLHYEAASRIDELFVQAEGPTPCELDESVDEQEAKNKKRKNKKPVKIQVWQYLTPVDVPGATAPVEASIKAIKFKGNKPPRLYSIILQKRKTPNR